MQEEDKVLDSKPEEEDLVKGENPQDQTIRDKDPHDRSFESADLASQSIVDEGHANPIPYLEEEAKISTNPMTLHSFHSMQSLLEQAMNLKFLLQTLVQNEEAQRLLPSNHDSFGQIIRSLDATINKIQNNMNADPQEITDQLMELRGLLQGEPHAHQNNMPDPRMIAAAIEQQQQAQSLKRKLTIQALKVAQFILVKVIPILQSDELFYLVTFLFIETLFIGSTLSLIKRIPNLGHIIDWLSSDRLAHYYLLMAAIAVGMAAWSFFFLVWRVCIGSVNKEQMKKMLFTLLELNPLNHLFLLVLSDRTLVTNKLDLFIWSLVILFHSIQKTFIVKLGEEYMKTIQNINTNYLMDRIKIFRLLQFAKFCFTVNVVSFVVILWLFYPAGEYILSLLLYGNISLFLDSGKYIVMLMSSSNQLNHYATNNTTALNEPSEIYEITIDSLIHIVRIVHYIQIIGNFITNESWILNLWVGFCIKCIHDSGRVFHHHISVYRKIKNLAGNLNSTFPLVQPDKLKSDDMCAICHEQLIVARKLPCDHIFHGKCLFGWVKNNQNSCPICRKEIIKLNPQSGSPLNINLQPVIPPQQPVGQQQAQLPIHHNNLILNPAGLSPLQPLRQVSPSTQIDPLQVQPTPPIQSTADPQINSNNDNPQIIPSPPPLNALLS